jgi:hypothetical protein
MKNVTPLVRELKKCNKAYRLLCATRAAVPLRERLDKWPAMQREADALCGAIMRLERKIITKLLE